MNTTIAYHQIHGLTRWNTPSVYNALEQLIAPEELATLCNQEELHDFMPDFGAMAGFAVTVVIEPGNPEHKANTNAWKEYRDYVARLPGPKIVIVQDLNKPALCGSFWGEVNSSRHRALGCVGTITDGGVRDLNEMTRGGFKALARRACVGHAFSTPVRWNCPVEVFGTRICPGDLVHADQHGFLVIPERCHERILEATLFMDDAECRSVIPSGTDTFGKSVDAMLDGFIEANRSHAVRVKEQFNRRGEW